MIGIDFILRANTAAFTKGLAAVDNATSKLQKSLVGKFEGRDLARGLTTALGLSIEKIADKFARLWTGVTEDGERAFERLGKASEILTRKTIEAGTARLSDEQRYQLLLNQQDQLERRIANNRGKDADSIAKKMEDQIDLLDKQKQAEELILKINNEKVDASNELVKKQYEQIDAEKKAQQQRDEDARDELKKAQQQDEEYQAKIRERFAPSVEQLAAMDVGGFAAGDDPRLKARRILEKEAFAAQAGNRGDIKEALRLGGEAQSMREGLASVTGGGTALTAETAETALRKALDDTNKELEGVREQLKGLIKAQN